MEGQVKVALGQYGNIKCIWPTSQSKYPRRVEVECLPLTEQALTYHTGLVRVCHLPLPKSIIQLKQVKIERDKLSRHLCQVNPNSAHSFCNTSVGIIQLKVLPFTCPSTSVHLNVPFHSYGLLRSEIHNGSASGLSPHSEETGSLGDLYLPGSPDSVQPMRRFVMSKGLSVRSGPFLQLPPTESLSESSITNNICCMYVFLHFLQISCIIPSIYLY